MVLVFFVSKASLNLPPVIFEYFGELPFPPYHLLRLDFANVDNVSYDMRYEVFHCYEYNNVAKEDFDFESCEKFHRDNYWIKKN